MKKKLSYQHLQHSKKRVHVPHHVITRSSRLLACMLAQAFALMIRSSDAPALEPWLEEASRSGIAELRTFAAGIKRDQVAVLAALTYKCSQGQVEGQIHRLKLLKRQSYGHAGFDLLRHRVLARSA